jgi:rhodanese-related sulfurtransferase
MKLQQILEFLQNHWQLWAVLLLILVLLAYEEFKHKIQGLKKIKPNEAVRLINHRNALVVDIRDAVQFDSGHILGSTNASKSELEKNFDQIFNHKSRPVVLVDQNGTSSNPLAIKLVKAGFTEVYILSQGIASWKNANLPLTKKSP